MGIIIIWNVVMCLFIKNCDYQQKFIKVFVIELFRCVQQFTQFLDYGGGLYVNLCICQDDKF